MSLERQSSFTDLNQRSANEFKFGLLAGRRIVSTLPSHGFREVQRRATCKAASRSAQEFEGM
jgi:hypothetical protein